MPGRLEYAGETDTFAPLLTRRAAYPTEAQAKYAFQRSRAQAMPFTEETGVAGTGAVHIRLFACRPGILNETTGRIDLPRGHEVHCATDFLDAQDHRLYRRTLNFAFERTAWRMEVTTPPTAPTLWLSLEPSPITPFASLPWSRRTTPY